MGQRRHDSDGPLLPGEVRSSSAFIDPIFAFFWLHFFCFASYLAFLRVAFRYYSLRGIHMNMVFADSSSPLSIARQMLFTLFPSYFGDGPLPKCMMLPFGKRFLDVLRESGYMHLQSTKPDTVGEPISILLAVGISLDLPSESGARRLQQLFHPKALCLSHCPILDLAL